MMMKVKIKKSNSLIGVMIITFFPYSLIGFSGTAVVLNFILKKMFLERSYYFLLHFCSRNQCADAQRDFKNGEVAYKL